MYSYESSYVMLYSVNFMESLNVFNLKKH